MKKDPSKKSDSRKLQLVNEGIRKLQTSELRHVAGGVEKLQKTSYC